MKPRSTARLAFPLATALAALLAALAASAATYYWDTNGNTTGYGTATGTWLATTPGGTVGWSNNDAGTANFGAITTGTGDTLNFGTFKAGVNTGTITVSGTVSSGNMTFDALSGAIGFSGGTITLAANPTIAINNTAVTIGSVLAGAGTNLTKTGIGTLTLNGSATSTNTGGLIVNAGTLALDFSNIAPSTSLINDGRPLTLGGANFNILSLTGGVTTQTLGNVTVNAGGGTMLIDPNNGTSTTLTLGTLAPTAAGSSLTLGKAVTANTGTVTITTTTNMDAAGIYSGRIVFADGTANTGYEWATTASGGSPYTLSAYGGYAALDLTAGSDTLNSRITASQNLGGSRTTNTLKIENPAASQSLDLGANLLTLTGGGLLLTGTNSTTISGTSGATRLMGSASGDLVISQYNSGGLNLSAVIGNNGGATALTKAGTGPLTLSGSNTFTGGLFINSGNVVLGDPGALNSTVGSENAVTFSSSSTKTLSLGGNSVVVKSLNVIGNNPGVTILENASVNPATLTIGNSANAASVFNGVIQNGSGAGALTLKKSGTGSLTLNATNTFTGGVILDGGTVAFQSAGALNNNAITVTASTVMNPATMTNTAGITLSNSSILSIGTNTGTFATSGAVTGDGGITLSQLGQGATRLNFTSTANTFTGPIQYKFTPNAGQHGELTVNSFADSASPGAGNITFGVAGTGTNNHTFIYGSGAIAPLTLTNRQFEVGGSHALSIIDNSSTQALTINSNLIYSGSGAKTLTLQGSATGISTFGGNLVDGGGSNTVKIVKTGSGTWKLGGTNTYLAGTTLTTGTLQFTKLVAMPATGAVAAANNTTLAVNVGGAGEWTTGTSGNGTIGGLLGGLGGQVGGTVTYAGTATVAFDTSNASPTVQTYAGTIVNVGTTLGIKKLGVNTLELTGPNAYTGATTVSAGTLLVNSPGSLATGSAVAVNGGTLGGTGTIGGSVTVAAAGSLAPGASIGTLSITGSLNISALAAGTTGKLKFDLDTLAASDQIAVTGTLTIGTDALGFTDFAFTNLGGLQVGTYKLITSGSISGSLDPADLSGSLGGGFTGTLQITGNDLELVVTSGGNTAPTISAISDLSVPSGINTGALAFTVGDAETPASLTVTGSSSNPTLVPNANIVVVGSGASRSVTVTPVSGLTGTATITLTVSDGSLTANEVFTVTVTGNYTSWATSQGIPGEPATGDYDKDGLSNLVEYALGKDPKVSSSPAAVLSGNSISFTKGTEAIDNGDVSWTIETSTDLGATDDWTTSESQPAGDPALTISHTFTPSTPVQDFARLKVTRQP